MKQGIFSHVLDRLFYLPEKRQFQPSYFSDKETFSFYCKNGYAVVRNVVDEDAIKIIQDTYRELYERPDFYEAGGFITTPNYGEAAQQKVLERLKEANLHILPKIFDLNKCEHDFFSLLVMKFPNDGSYVEPHQDVSMVDELKATTTYLWIPVENIDETNGAMLVLPGSHLWGGWQKTHNRDITPLKKNSKWLISRMKPVYLNKGDVLLFDSSLIHASLPNTSGKVRFAMNTSVVPKGQQLVHYEVGPATPKGMVDRYDIDFSFWKNMDYIYPASGKYKAGHTEPLRCSAQLGKANLQYLLQKYS